jgi:nucleotide-binding universal stress UspA family protein
VIRTIVAAIDLGPVAEQVLNNARTFAEATGAELHVRHVTTSVPPGSAPSGAADAALRRDHELLSALVLRVLSEFRPATVGVLRGRTASAILHAARELDADLIVLGSHSGSDVSAQFLGTTADRVVREAGVPCLVARAALTEPPRSIVVPTDFSRTGTQALRTAGQLATAIARKAPAPHVHVLHVESTSEATGDVLLQIEAAESILGDAGLGTGVTSHVVAADDVAAEISAWTDRHSADLIVIGTVGRSQFKRILLGSVAARVARQAPRSVLLVPDAQAQREPALDCIAAGIDFSAGSIAAAEWLAADFAPAARRILIHVIDAPDRAAFVTEDDNVRDHIIADLKQDAEARMTRHFPAVAARDRCIVTGRTADALAGAARRADADLIAIGGHTHPRGLWGMLGTTAEHLVRSSEIPVLIISGRPDTPPRRILAGVDGSRFGPSVLRWVRLLAQRFDSAIHIVHVLNPRYVGAARRVSGMMAGPRTERSFEQQAGDWLARTVADAGLEPERCELSVSTGDSAWELLAWQQRTGADMIVLGSHGMGALGRAFIGSVSYAVVRGAPCPVLVVRGDPASGDSPASGSAS